MNLTITQAVTLNGGPGEDFVAGGAGNDTIDGGADDDQMYGNGGADQIINVEPGDSITDFNVREGDTQSLVTALVVNAVLPSSPQVVNFVPIASVVSLVEDPDDDFVRRVHA